ncbi:MAG: Acriflavin resistance protein [Candidatus Ozemobacter sibiricus]|uniref:Acriflavin resistance protein n=1 Tax=Candidatus Ozemobacter sibiricus TaxID=2268124 RepID=A0A367ZR08_9BACT|nr:MAG: Acriflavin resistance protein [Candidatus Ozemobacter sibiricus]
MEQELNFSGRFVGKFVNSKLTPLLVITSLLIGYFALTIIPREEEPQIIVPMVDIFVGMPGASADQVENRVVRPLEKLVWEIPGVEYVYSTSSEEQAMVIVRFRVGEDLERSLVKLSEKLEHHKDRIPPGVVGPVVKNRTIDDVPFLALTFWSRQYDHEAIRRVAAEVSQHLKAIPDVSVTTLTGGMPRAVVVHVDPGRLAGHGVSLFELTSALQAANRKFSAGSFDRGDALVTLEAGSFLSTREDVENLVVAVRGQRPIRLLDVATVTDSTDEPDNYVFIDFGPAAATELPEVPAALREGGPAAAVTLSIAKRQGTNAIFVGDVIREKLAILRQTLIPEGVHIQVTRDYGKTAQEKADDLFTSMGQAVALVMIILFMTLSLRVALVSSVSIPVTLALVMFSFYAAGYTLNRITLFAMIFSIGLLTDDAVVVLENMIRHIAMPRNRGRDPGRIAQEAVAEIGDPTILANIAIVLAVMPMAFVRGMMGPYMEPIPIGTAAAAMLSLLVAYVVTPWAAIRFVKFPEPVEGSKLDEPPPETVFERFYRRIITPLVMRPMLRWGFIIGAWLIVLGAILLVPLQIVKVKILPFDNKSEFQVVLDLPEGTTLERTAAVTREIAEYLKTVPEVTDLEMYVGTAGPFNFNGLVRHWFLRRGSNVADIQVNLAPKGKRTAKSHDIALRVRGPIQEIARRSGANAKIAEVPPGPPVLQTLVIEVYGPNEEGRQQVARQIRTLLEQTPGVVDIDTYTEDDQRQIFFEVDQPKAARLGLSPEQIAQAIRMLVAGAQVGLMHMPVEREDVALLVRLPKPDRSSLESILALRLASPTSGRTIPLGEVVTPREKLRDKSRYHKNLQPVVYLTADVAGAEESPVYPILKLVKTIGELRAPDGGSITQWHTQVPLETVSGYSMKFDGEWQITYEVFRDLGLAFAAVMVLIYFLMVGWYQDFITPIGIMLPVPFSLAGVLPGHALLGAFFTATSMIGFIAGAGIIVRNSLLLIDFIIELRQRGLTLEKAVIEAAVIRLRPMVLTSLSTLIGATVMLTDPIFQGLAIAIVFGEIASTCLTRIAVPVIFYQVEKWRAKEG